LKNVKSDLVAGSRGHTDTFEHPATKVIGAIGNATAPPFPKNRAALRTHPLAPPAHPHLNHPLSRHLLRQLPLQQIQRRLRKRTLPRFRRFRGSGGSGDGTRNPQTTDCLPDASLRPATHSSVSHPRPRSLESCAGKPRLRRRLLRQRFPCAGMRSRWQARYGSTPMDERHFWAVGAKGQMPGLPRALAVSALVGVD